MEYKYCKSDNFEDYASGRVLYNGKGITNFPARLAGEIFGRCLEYTEKKHNISVYDCCCGGGYMLTVLGFMNADILSELTGSDISPYAVDIAQSNLELLKADGMDKRIGQIRELAGLYGKKSHKEAEQSAIRLRKLIEGKDIRINTFAANALNCPELDKVPDIIITDVPYGELVSWEGATDGSVDRLLESLYGICGNHTIIGICMDKSQKNTSDKFKRLEKQQVGKRKFEILRKK